jgi:DNA (cytosine-5)-methyltransferase 3A
MKELNVISMFDGISCGRVALERAGFKVGNYWAYEIEPNAISISKYNYPDIKHMGSVLDTDFIEYKDIDLLIGGSECTQFSKAKCSKTAKKKREIRPEEGEGWELFKQYVKAKNTINPTYFLFENNYGMADEIKDAITKELGVEPILIDSQLVSAQRRKRLYWTNIPGITQPEDKGILVKDIICDDPELIKYFDDRIRNTMIKCENYIKYDLGGKGHYSQQDRLYFLDNKAPTVPRCRTETKFNVYLGGEKYKKTCPLEIERLQTLPDNYTEFGIKDGKVVKMPKTRRFEAIGNGWTVDVIAHIFSFIKDI